jgi:DNA-directed RNA polymerase specialized sigma24 family protein
LVQNEQAVRSYIRDELYPASLYPPKKFPAIHDIVLRLFLEAVNRDPVKRSVYQTCRDLDRLHTLVRSEVAFSNILRHHTDIVISIYRPMIAAFVQSVHGRQHDHEEVVQEILAEIVTTKMRSVRNNYDFTYRKGGSFTSYFMAVVRNVYFDRMRKQRNDPLTMTEPSDAQMDSFATVVEDDREWMKGIVMAEESERLDEILSLFYRLRSKVELCLKLKFRVPVREEDVLRCFPRCRSKDIEILCDDYRNTTDQVMYDLAVAAFNRYESVKNLGDSLRKWVNTKANEQSTPMSSLNIWFSFTSRSRKEKNNFE